MNTILTNKGEDSKKTRLDKYFTTHYPDLATLIEKYSSLFQKNATFIFGEFRDLKDEIYSLRQKLLTATENKRTKLCLEIDSKVKSLEPFEKEYKKRMAEEQKLKQIIKEQIQGITDKKAIQYLDKHCFWMWIGD